MDPRHPHQSPSAAAHAHMEHVMSPGGGTLRTIHCTNDYAHIWETPLPEPSSLVLGSGGHQVQETTYAAQCDCAYSGTLEQCAGHHTLRCFPGKDDPGTLVSRGKGGGPSRKAYIATKPVPGHTEDCFEGHRYFVIDRQDSAPVVTTVTAVTGPQVTGGDTASGTGPDIIPLEVAS